MKNLLRVLSLALLGVLLLQMTACGGDSAASSSASSGKNSAAVSSGEAGENGSASGESDKESASTKPSSSKSSSSKTGTSSSKSSSSKASTTSSKATSSKATSSKASTTSSKATASTAPATATLTETMSRMAREGGSFSGYTPGSDATVISVTAQGVKPNDPSAASANTSKIKSLISNAKANTVIDFPKGTYYISTGFSLSGKTQLCLRGNGSTLIATSYAPAKHLLHVNGG